MKKNNQTIENQLIAQSATVKDAMRKMSQHGKRVIYVVDAKHKLLGAISDGDVRKWILADGTLNDSIKKVYNPNPITITTSQTIDDAKRLMLELKIESIPVLKANKHIVQVLEWGQIFINEASLSREKLGVQVVIMAGGKGTRLDPFTQILPKPLIPIGNRSIIELIMDKFHEYGVDEFNLSVGHKSRMVKAYFHDMVDKYKINYIEETKPLGTVGGIALIKDKVKDAVMVTNCDIIIESDYKEILDFHREHKYDLTIVASYRHFVIPYGVCEMSSGGALKSISEKPEYDLLVNTGMYVMQRKVVDLIPKNKYFNATELIQKAKKKGFKIGIFPISEKSWIDVGQWEEYHMAIEKLRKKG